MKILKITLIIVSVGLNFLFGFMYFKGIVFQRGYTAGLQDAQSQLDALLEQGRLVDATKQQQNLTE